MNEPKRTLPTIPASDPRFVYTPSVANDIRKTFARFAPPVKEGK